MLDYLIPPTNKFHFQQSLGGGTPSLILAELIVNVISELAKYGFMTGPQTEITIEINPATVDKKNWPLICLTALIALVSGHKTFSDLHLKAVHREHNAEQTVQTLKLLQKMRLNF